MPESEVIRDTLSRAGLRQMAGLGLIGALSFVGLLAALSWASSLTSGSVETFGAVDIEAKAISTVIRNEPPQLDSTRMQDVVSGIIVGHVMEGLARYDATGGVLPGVAERWEIRPDGATFWLRPDSCWSDGQPVTRARRARLPSRTRA